jgi:hypothetical protein|tara:strand:- start:872 stop:1018 length:147 start_codon:yes stop_codon:yes gene_type:complete
MLKQILELLAIEKHYGQSENIEIAKGKYKIPKTFKETFESIKRQWKIR